MMADTVAEVVTRLPARQLRPFVRRYVGYRMEGFPAGIHRGLPSKDMTFLISLDRPIETLPPPGSSATPTARQGVVGGLQTGPTLIRHAGTELGIAVEMTAGGTRALFGFPAIELTSVVTELVDVLGPAGRVLPERLAEASDWAARFLLLDQVLGSAALRGATHGTPPEIAYAWRQLLTADVRPSVADLAVEVEWSRRHFSEIFHREVGLPPRQFLRLLRFEQSATILGRHPDIALAELANRCGYFDQPHLYREWREFAGCAPAVWAQQEALPSVHDPALQVEPS